MWFGLALALALSTSVFSALFLACDAAAPRLCFGSGSRLQRSDDSVPVTRHRWYLVLGLALVAVVTL